MHGLKLRATVILAAFAVILTTLLFIEQRQQNFDYSPAYMLGAWAIFLWTFIDWLRYRKRMAKAGIVAGALILASSAFGWLGIALKLAALAFVALLAIIGGKKIIDKAGKLEEKINHAQTNAEEIVRATRPSPTAYRFEAVVAAAPPEPIHLLETSTDGAMWELEPSNWSSEISQSELLLRAQQDGAAALKDSHLPQSKFYRVTRP